MPRIPREAKVTPYGIFGFFGKFRPLSNFHYAKVWYGGDEYPTTENAFQAAKISRADRGQFFRLSPGDAKSLGARVKIDSKKWERRRVRVMVEANLSKYTSHADLRALLLSTGSKYLEETNDWYDTFWGVCGGKGLNVLGRVLMEIRSFLRYSSHVDERITKAICREVLNQISDLSLVT